MTQADVQSHASNAADGPIRDRVQQVLNLIRPAVQSDGGDVELVDVSADGIVSVRLHGDTIEMTLKEGRREREEITLATGAVFEDPAIRLAPLSTAAAWRRWFEVVFVGHFLAADIPGC